MYSLSVCADTVYLDLPFVERVKKIAASGFFVEFWNWRGRDMEAIAADPKVRICAFTGYLKGSMVHPDGVEDLLAGMRESVAVAAGLKCKLLFLSSGELDGEGQVVHRIADHPATKWITAYKTLCQVAELAEKHDLIYALEHLNTKIDHPGFPFPRVEDALNLVIQVGSPRIKLLLDIYHTQIQEGDLVDVIHRSGAYIGHVHVADVPGRHEPGTGEINYRRIAQAFQEIGYQGVVGLEAFPKNSSEEALSRFAEVFS